MKWTRIQDTQLAKVGIRLINDNVNLHGLTYHNLEHVESMYEYLHTTQEPYDENVDWAVLYHDSVYDAFHGKELRSAELFRDLSERYEGCTASIDAVMSMIESTETHKIGNSSHSAIIRADLHGLTDTATSIINYGKILTESKILYSISNYNFACANVKFMRVLRSTMLYNCVTDSNHEVFYKDVVKGIDLTKSLNELLIEIGNL